MNGLTSLQEQQLKIFYYFMLSDGDLSNGEQNELSAICKEMGISDEIKNSLITSINNRQKYVSEDGNVDTSRVEKTLFNLLNNSDAEINYRMNKKIRLETFWNLIDLGYADGNYTDTEKEIVSTIKKKWNISDRFQKIAIDIIETIIMLSKKYDFVVNSDLDESNKTNQLNQIISDFTLLTNDMKNTISDESLAKDGSGVGVFGFTNSLTSFTNTSSSYDD